MQEGDPILGGDANNVSGGQTPENGNAPSLSDTNGDSTAKDIDAALSSVTMPDSSEPSDSSDPSELKISHDDSPTPPPVHILGQDITGITDEDFTPLSSNPEPTPQIILPSGSSEAPTESTTTEASTSPQTNASSSPSAIPTAPNSTSTQAPGAETPATPTVTTSAAAIPSQAAPQPITSTAPAPVQPESPAPESNYAAEFKQSVKASVSGESGDIILSKDPKDPKKTRKGLIIGIVIALIVVVGLCAGLGVVLSSNQKNNPNTVATKENNIHPTQEDKDNFYKYANEIIYGEIETTTPLGDQIENTFEYSDFIFNGPDSNQDYFEEIHQKYNDFYNQLSLETNDTSNTALYLTTTDYKQLLDFLAINPSDGRFSFGSIIATYLDEGYDAVKSTIDTVLSEIPENNIYAESFRPIVERQFSATIDFVYALESSHCVVDGGIATECASQIDLYNENGESLETIMNDSYGQMNDLLIGYYNYIGSRCWQISKALEGEYKE